MSAEIDWSKAPKWANKRVSLGLINVQAWANEEKYMYDDGHAYVFDFNNTGHTYSHSETKIICNRPLEWNGEGLPPVGTECLFNNVKGVIKCHVNSGDGESAVIQFKNSWGAGHAGYFRPIKSERDRAIEEMSNDTVGTGYAKSAFGKLYDAGWRKQ